MSSFDNVGLAVATSSIMMSGDAGDWVTLETIGGYSRPSKDSFITLRTGHVINTKAFGKGDIENCEVVRVAYFAGNKVDYAYIKSSLAAVNEALNIKSVRLLMATKEKPALED